MKVSNILGLGLFVIAFSGCEVKVGEAVVGSVEPANEASIVGIWSTDCMVDSSNSYIKSFQVENGTLTWASSNYQGSTVCNQANLAYTYMKSGTLTITGDNAIISGAKNYELKINVVALVPNSVAFTAMINADNFCDSNAWVSGQAGFIFGCNAPGSFDLSQVNFNTTQYGVFDIEAAATPNFMQFESGCAIAGYEDICPTANDRPTTLDGTVYYRR